MQIFIKKNYHTWRLLLFIILSVLLNGCTGAPKLGQSGFLRDYSQLEPDPAFGSALRYANPSKKLQQYRMFIIDPVMIHFAPHAEGAAIDPTELKKLTDYFRDEAVKALSKKYQVVNSAGPGVLRIRAAITDIKKTNVAFNIEPRLKALGLGLGGASMEAEALDSVSGERIIAVVDSQSGGRFMGYTAGLTKFGHAKQVMKGWIKRFIKTLDEAHG